MGGSKNTQQTQTKSDPWEPAQPILKDILGNVSDLGKQNEIFKPVVGDTTMQAVAAAKAQAAQPSQSAGVYRDLASGAGLGYQTGAGALRDTASGGMLGANPYLDRALGTATQRAAEQVNSQFSGAGRYGSGAHTGVLADRLGSIETNARVDNYNAERQNQLNAANLLTQQGLNAGSLAGASEAADAGKVNQLLQAGQMQDTMDTAIQTAPLNATQWMAGLGIPIAGLGGTSNSTTTTRQSPNVAGMIGSGLMTGLGLMTGNPTALGGLGGMFGGSMFGGGGPAFSAPQMRSMNGYF